MPAAAHGTPPRRERTRESPVIATAALASLLALAFAARELAGFAHALPMRDPRGPRDLTPSEWRAVSEARAALERARDGRWEADAGAQREAVERLLASPRLRQAATRPRR